MAAPRCTPASQVELLAVACAVSELLHGACGGGASVFEAPVDDEPATQCDLSDVGLRRIHDVLHVGITDGVAKALGAHLERVAQRRGAVNEYLGVAIVRAIRAGTLVADDDRGAKRGTSRREGLTEEGARGDGGVLGGVRPAPLAAPNPQARVELGRRAYCSASACEGSEGDLASARAGELGGAQPACPAACAADGRAVAQRSCHVRAEGAADDAQHDAPAVVAVDPLSGQVHGELGVVPEQGGDHRSRGGDSGVATWLVIEGLAEERVAGRLEHEAGGDIHAYGH